MRLSLLLRYSAEADSLAFAIQVAVGHQAFQLQRREHEKVAEEENTADPLLAYEALPHSIAPSLAKL